MARVVHAAQRNGLSLTMHLEVAGSALLIHAVLEMNTPPLQVLGACRHVAFPGTVPEACP
jgi:hypothetical protein